MKTKVSVLIVMLFAMLLGGCVNPVTGNRELMLNSVQNDISTGKQYAPEVEKQLYGKIEDVNIQNYINSVGQKIARVSHMPDLNFTYTAVNHDSVNAVALPGGYIFITRGLLEKLNSEAQLAGILAHETVHVTARHSESAASQQAVLNIAVSYAMKNNESETLETLTDVAQGLIGLKYSRTHELEADQYGMDYMVKAGYDPKGMIETMQILEAESKNRTIEFLSTHPNPGNREDLLTRYWNLKGYNYSTDGLRVGESDYRNRVLIPLKSVPKVAEP